MGTGLLDRRPDGLILTEAGQALLPMVEMLESAVEVVSEDIPIFSRFSYSCFSFSVIPAKAGIQSAAEKRDIRFCGYDELRCFDLKNTKPTGKRYYPD